MTRLEELLAQIKDFGQAASNSAASNISAPVDGVAWLLRQGGVKGLNNPVGGSDWMREKGLTAEPQNKTGLAALLGEAAGGSAPIAAWAKSPEIAGGLLQMLRSAKYHQSMK